MPSTIRVLERGWLSANNIVFFDDAHTASVVDTGYVLHAQQTVDGVRHALEGRHLTRIVNTHLHSDHCGGNAALQKAYGGPNRCLVMVPVGEMQAVNNWDEDALSYRSSGQQIASFTAAGELAAGQTMELGGMSWQAHAAPGHDPNALMLFQPEIRVLISGDALWEQGFGVVFPEMVGERGFEATGATLEAIDALDPAVVIPGHGAPFTDARAALARAHARLKIFAAAPERHARHGLRVLLKFHLLQQPAGVAAADLYAWFAGADFVVRTVRTFWPASEMREIFSETLEALLQGGLARRSDELILDSDPA